MSSKDKNTQNSDETQSNNNMETYINDIQDLDILTIQSNAQLILIIAYYFEYIATQQAIGLIYKNINSLQESNNNSEENQNMMNEAINADKIAFLAAKLEIYAQTILTRLDYIKLQRFPGNISNISSSRFALTRTANKEIFIGAMFAQIVYIFNFEGVKILYSISNTNPLFDE